MMKLKIIPLTLALTCFLMSLSHSSRATTDVPQSQIIDEICQHVTESFYDVSLKGLDWGDLCQQTKAKLPVAPETFPQIANELLGALQTSHTEYAPQDSVKHAILLDVFRILPTLKPLIKKYYGGERPHLESTGFFSTEIGGKHFVDHLLQGSAAEKAGLLTGDEIIEVGGEAYHPVLSFKGKAGHPVEITYRRQKDGPVATLSASVEKAVPFTLFDKAAKNSVRIEERDGKRIGYMRFWSLSGKEPQALFRNATSYDGDLGFIQALVIDIRVMVGGGMLPLEIIRPTSLSMTIISREGTSKQPERHQKYPLVTIIDHHTRSAGEMLANLIKQKKIGTLVGETTSGSLTGGDAIPLSNGAILYLAVMGIEHGGVTIEGKGVSPDVPVDFSLPYSAGKDPFFEKAMAVALEKLEK